MGYGDTITLNGIVDKCIYEPQEMRFKLEGKPNAIYFPKGIAPPLLKGHYVKIQARRIKENDETILQVYSLTAQENKQGGVELFMYSAFEHPSRRQYF